MRDRIDRTKVGPVPLLCGPRTIAGPSRLQITTYRRNSVQYRAPAHIDKAAVLSWQHTHCTSSTNTHDAMRAAGEQQCLIPDRTPKLPGGHKCRGECAGRLHGVCGQVEDPDRSDSPLHPICATCPTAHGSCPRLRYTVHCSSVALFVL